MQRPWLSVIVPTFRGERYLPFALGSIASENDSGIECLVVDDGSDDATLAVARSFEDRMRIRFVEGPRKRNWVASTNAGLRAASSELACFLHQDDAWRVGRAAAIRDTFARHPSVRVVFHSSRFVDARGRSVGEWHCPLPPDVELSPDDVVPKLLVQNFVAIPSPVFRTEDARASGGLDEQLWYTADWDLWLRLVRYGPVVYLDRSLSDFRVHPESQTMTKSENVDDFRDQLMRVLERHRTGMDDATVRAARFSIEINVALAAMAHGSTPELAALVRTFPTRPRELARYIRDSRILERTAARVRVAARARLRGEA